MKMKGKQGLMIERNGGGGGGQGPGLNSQLYKKEKSWKEL